MEKLRLSLVNENEEGEEKIFSDGVNVSSSEDEEDEDAHGSLKHQQLLESVRVLDGKNNRSRKLQRTEATTTVSEFGLGNYEDDKLEVADLLSSLGKTVIQAKLKKTVNKLKKDAQVLPAPLLKPEAEKVKRIVAYNEICNDLSKWDRVVYQNRQADQLRFPLKQSMLTMEPIEKVAKRFKYSTPLEKEIAELLQAREVESGTERNVDDPQHFDLEEAIAMRQEMRRIRAQQSYEEAKFRRKSKIKSKRYHRIMKREKLKKEMKDFEELQKTNPELAAEKFQEMDSQRILERMTLRHRNTGKWAKYQLLRSKHDKESGRVIQEQIEMNRALTAKQFVLSDSEDETPLPQLSKSDSSAGLHNPFENMPRTDSSNPWMSSMKFSKIEDKNSLPAADSEAPISSGNYRKFWNEENKKRERERENKERSDESSESSAEEMDEKLPEFQTDEMGEVDEIFQRAKDKQRSKVVEEKDEKEDTLMSRRRRRKRKVKMTQRKEKEDTKDNFLDETLERKQRLEDFEAIIADASDTENTFANPRLVSERGASTIQAGDGDNAIDPNDFITVKQTVIKCKAPDMENYDDEALDDVTDENRHMTIAEAFADDDVIEEFKKEKEAIIDRDTPKDIDLTLPGWGEWGGIGVKISKNRRRFIAKAPPAPPRKDRQIGHVIINENANEKLKPHLISKIPFPFRTVEEFENSIRDPVGKNWLPETAFQKVIAPKIITKMGTIIDPMDADAIQKDSMGTADWM